MLSQRVIELIKQRATKTSWDKNAFNCSRCPKNGCPAWIDHRFTLENKDTKKQVEQDLRGCGFVLHPILINDMMVTMYQNLDKNESVRKGVEKTCKGIDNYTNETSRKIVEGMTAMLKLMGAKDIQRIVLENKELRKQLEERDKEINLIEQESEGEE